jgi:hypothetical protein
MLVSKKMTKKDLFHIQLRYHAFWSITPELGIPFYSLTNCLSTITNMAEAVFIYIEL